VISEIPSMARRASPPLPSCFALVIQGLEKVAADEIKDTLSAEIKRTLPGMVVFRTPEINKRLLALRTVEDVFLLAWGSDELTHRFEDLKHIEAWTAREADWASFLQLHHQIHAKPKGTPGYRLVAQMEGRHAYRRVDVQKALAQGLRGKLPARWRAVEENASVEVWIRIMQSTAVCGIRLSDRTMRHRTYKREHIAASLRPTVAAAMARLADIGKGELLLDPCCGAGTILAEHLESSRNARALGGDIDKKALVAARSNLRRYQGVHLVRWDARRLPLADTMCRRIACNPPFGKQLGKLQEIHELYRSLVSECNRVLAVGGRAVFLVADPRPLQSAARQSGWQSRRPLKIRVLGQAATVLVFLKP
jgi:23S rRNA G2445 N2-methylase RlmL